MEVSRMFTHSVAEDQEHQRLSPFKQNIEKLQ